MLKIYRMGEKIEYKYPSLALGNFDGMHLGHIEVLKEAQKYGDGEGVLLFETESSPLLKHNGDEITDISEKIEILNKLSVDFVYLVQFNEEFMNMSGAEFSKFLSEIGVKYVTVGYDYRCSKGASLDADGLKELLKIYGIETSIVEPVLINGEPVKSTKIREYLKYGEVDTANSMLFFPYSLSGVIAHGLKNGRDMGFPTANIETDKKVMLPDGVYLARCIISKDIKKAVVNIGKNPTFDAEKRTVEAHIIDYNSDIYGNKIKIEFLERIRGEIKFSSVSELILQISKDVSYAKQRDITE